ncbi:uncharacterized protein B0H64DRAFT_21132 [Chaetomium fimeti]|uniref:Uncharacterized protein n=1 Tax=Chaetomium fimeti TaxID=1854472 RepID=A0AAE0HQ79_9PEZI|nr:hypothetical protein B0H64DRAFT_21132 [Chaetomium fimeti]
MLGYGAERSGFGVLSTNTWSWKSSGVISNGLTVERLGHGMYACIGYTTTSLACNILALGTSNTTGLSRVSVSIARFRVLGYTMILSVCGGVTASDWVSGVIQGIVGTWVMLCLAILVELGESPPRRGGRVGCCCLFWAKSLCFTADGGPHSLFSELPLPFWYYVPLR